MKKFEYLHITDNLNLDELNKLGDQGWELVAYAPIANIYIWKGYVFKREKVDEEKYPTLKPGSKLR